MTFSMENPVKWRDKSFQTIPGIWVPEARVDLIEGPNMTEYPIYPSATDHEKIKKCELIYPTRGQAKTAAFEMAKRFAWNKWSIPEESIQEY